MTCYRMTDEEIERSDAAYRQWWLSVMPGIQQSSAGGPVGVVGPSGPSAAGPSIVADGPSGPAVEVEAELEAEID
jgi:hypothetical protein